MKPTYDIRVLVLDTDASHRDALATTLSHLGCRPDVCPSLDDALSAIERQAYHVALLEVDDRTPWALSAIDSVQRAPTSASIIGMADTDRLDTVLNIIRRGARDFIRKPAGEVAIASSVDRLCHENGWTWRTESEFRAVFGHRIRQERNRRSLTLRELAELSQMTASQLSQAELGKTSLSLWAVARLSQTLRMRVGELFSNI